MSFTAAQYDEAIQRLQDAKTQLTGDGHCCAVCGDSGHMAWTCGFNPLVAMTLCHHIANNAKALHDTLHYLCGEVWHMGERLGPARIIVPEGAENEPLNKE